MKFAYIRFVPFHPQYSKLNEKSHQFFLLPSFMIQLRSIFFAIHKEKMKAYKAALVLGFIWLGFFSNLNGQLSRPASVMEEDLLPKVFVLGEYEQNYEKAVPEYEQLLNVCDKNIVTAYNKWQSMMAEMVAYSKRKNFDLNGVKLWLHVFWSKEGHILHIGFHLRPTSRNLDNELVADFLNDFIKDYQFPILTDSKFTHYTTVAFPISASKR